MGLYCRGIISLAIFENWYNISIKPLYFLEGLSERKISLFRGGLIASTFSFDHPYPLQNQQTKGDQLLCRHERYYRLKSYSRPPRQE